MAYFSFKCERLRPRYVILSEIHTKVVDTHWKPYYAELNDTLKSKNRGRERIKEGEVRGNKSLSKRMERGRNGKEKEWRNKEDNYHAPL